MSLVNEIKSTSPALIDAGIKQHTLYLLTQSYLPSALIELTCLSNPQEEARLSTPGYRQRLAVAIATGVLNYLTETSHEFQTAALAAPKQANH